MRAEVARTRQELQQALGSRITSSTMSLYVRTYLVNFNGARNA